MAGKINVPITTAIQGLANTQRQLATLSRGISSIGRTAGLAAIGFAAFTAGLKGADFAVQAIAGARDLERNLLGLKTVFEDVEPQMRRFSEQATSMGLSINEASKASIFIGSVLKQSGFSIRETADLTEELVGLATDLSLTYGYDVQEALMGMTALFRGEYDPIEKFGVAMKQSEINAELAARKLNHLEGAQRRFAEQQIRVELLFQRSQDAQGAFERGAGTLAVEQLKLQSVFNNMRDTVATGLLPAMGLLTQSFREALEGVEPEIKESFDALEPVLYNLGNIIIPALEDALIASMDALQSFLAAIEPLIDPTTELGGAISSLTTQLQSLFGTLSDTTATEDTGSAFQALGEILAFVIGLFERIAYWIEVISIRKRILEERFASFFNLDWDTFFSDWDAYAQSELEQIEISKQLRDSQYQYNYQLSQTQLLINKLANMPGIERGRGRARLNVKAEDILPKPDDDDVKGQAKQTSKNYVDEFFKSLKEDVQKQTARQQLALKGASEGLIDAILGSEGWMKIWQQIKSGKIALEDLQDQFYRTAAGAKELKSAADEAARLLEEYNEKVARINERLAEELARIAEKAAEAKQGFKDLLDGFSVLPTVEREFGKFQTQVVGYLEEIETSLKNAFRNKDILEAGYKELQAYARREIALLQEIAKQRDDLAQRYEFSKTLIENYRQAFTATLELTNLFSQLKDESEKRSVTEVQRGIVTLGNSLRQFEVTIARTYEETIESVTSKSEGLVQSFRDMAVRARDFASNLRTLRQLQLDPKLFQQLVDAGVEAGGETAKALVEGGEGAINEINSIYREIDALGADLGEEVAVTLYGTGIDLVNGLLEGIRSKEMELENQAIKMAEAFNKAFQSRINVQIDVAADAASAAARQTAADAIAALGPAPVVPPIIDEAALNQINSLIAGANRYIKNVTDPLKAAGAGQKLNIYEALRQDILAGTAVNTSGIVSGLSSTELANRARATGTTQTFNINVTADGRTSGAKAGEAIVESLQKFSNTNGNFTVGITT
jgi:hypothetical protein